MKTFIIDIFKKSPVCTGMMLFLIALHLVGAKDLRTPISMIQKELALLFFLYIFCMGSFVLFISPKIEEQKQAKIVWRAVVFVVFVLTIIAKIITL